MTEYRKKMIEVAMPLEAINAASQHEKSVPRKGHPATLHLRWARRPLASCRAVLFGQLVDDPSSWPDLFPTEKAQDAERQRLFRILEELVLWENSNNTRVLNAARKEIAQSLARNRVADGEANERDEEVLAESATPEVVNAYLAEVAPPVHDPFAGGGSIPLEAQRLGLRAIATDLNPVAVLINKALIEIPPKFAGRAPVHPEAEQRMNWSGAEGLAEDVRHYGEWMRAEAKKRIGHLYPEVDLPEEHGGGKAAVIAWLWARTVESPDPAFKGVHVPLVRSFMLSTKKGKRAWVEPVLSEDRRSYRFEIRAGEGEPKLAGTVVRQGGTCLSSGAPLPFKYIRTEGQAGRMGVRLMAVVAEGNRKRIYLPPTDEMQQLAESAQPTFSPETGLEGKAKVNVGGYGLRTHGDLFTPRQLVALTTFSDLVLEARDKVIADARAAGWADDGKGLEDGALGAVAYGDSLATYLQFSVSKLADWSSSICSWISPIQGVRNTFARQAIPMAWDFTEVNPLSNSVGNFLNHVEWVASSPHSLPSMPNTGTAFQAPAQAMPRASTAPCVSTDPPYYDNISYADLSDFFYVWLRRNLNSIFPRLFGTVLVPKAEELVATPARHGSKDQANSFFLGGMTEVMNAVCVSASTASPVTIYYAFKQSETKAGSTSSTGWEAFLAAVLASGLAVTATLPIRTERAARTIGIGANALASSMVLVCRLRHASSPIITRGDFRRLLLNELPAAIHDLEKGNIAPVDMSQASIGPGMAVFSRHSKVIEADGSAMSVRTALQIIHEVVDEVRGGEETDLDAKTRFAITWFETHGFAEGPYGDSEILATSCNVSVEAVKRAGLVHSAASKTRLRTREQLPEDWDPVTDTTLTVWECTQHLIKRLEEKGEEAAAALLRAIGPRADAARTLAYRLYTHCERKGDAEEARAYNGLVVAWPELERLASTATVDSGSSPTQSSLYE
ncbi:MAG: hypothetical protein CMJ94_11325 [Planctomycetes bacterium]|nr:hypothetical protein [Planctomycetota bacterium]